MVKAIFSQLTIVVGEMEAARDFYRRLGVDVPGPGDPRYAPFHAGGQLSEAVTFDMDTAAFAQVWNKGWAGRNDLKGKVVIGFAVESREAVDALYAELTGAGYVGLQPPWDAFWGARYAIIEDPNGAAVGLMSPIDPERRYWPPEGWTE